MKKSTAVLVATVAALALSGSAFATMEIQKEYKAKDPAAKCETCHTAKMPKKGAGDDGSTPTARRRMTSTPGTTRHQ